MGQEASRRRCGGVRQRQGKTRHAEGTSCASYRCGGCAKLWGRKLQGGGLAERLGWGGCPQRTSVTKHRWGVILEVQAAKLSCRRPALV